MRPRRDRVRAGVAALRGWPWLKAFVTLSVMLAIGAVLLVNGLLVGELGTVGRGDTGPGPGRSAGGVTDAHVEGLALPAGTIALTFEGGPDPRWTPQVLGVLRRYGVPATFFVQGSQAARHPDLLRAVRRQGSEIGLASFTRSDLLAASGSRVDRELTLTQLTLAGATGEVTYVVRPRGLPASRSTGAGSALAGRLQAQGFVTSSADVDGRDQGRRPSADQIVAASVPAPGTGATVLLHDGGGDQTQTVAALDRLIPRLQHEGWTFTTVTGGAALRPAAAPASGHDRFVGRLVIAAAAVSTWSVRLMIWCLIGVGVLMLVRQVVMLVVAGRHARRTAGSAAGPRYDAPVTVVVPAYNEKECIAATVGSLLASRHPVEIVVVDDGSTDGTADIVEAMAAPGVRLVRQVNGGKPAALNTGIAVASHEIVVMIDGDTVFEPTTVGELVRHFVRPEVGAVAGNAKVANRRSLVARWQHIEYVMGFNLDRRVQEAWRAMVTVPGAVGAFRRTALVAAGGVSDETLAEDTDLTMAVSRAGWQVVYEEHARAWTEAPESLGQLWRQRYRWSYGTMQAMWKHRAAMWDRGASGRFGRVGLGNLALFGILLPVFAPLCDLLFVYSVLFGRWVPIAAWLGMQAFQVAVAAYAFRLDRERLGVLWLLPLQQFVYRQMMYAVLVQSLVTAAAGTRLGWHKLRRVGDFDAVPVELATAQRPAADLRL